jgi:hypothetical protein
MRFLKFGQAVQTIHPFRNSVLQPHTSIPVKPSPLEVARSYPPHLRALLFIEMGAIGWDDIRTCLNKYQLKRIRDRTFKSGPDIPR